MPHKKAKRNHPTAAALDCRSPELSTSHNPLLSLEKPVGLRKRKRTHVLLNDSSEEPHLESDPKSDGGKEPSAKRARQCSSDPASCPDYPLVPWQGLEEQPRLEKEKSHYDLTQAYFQQSHINAMRFLNEYRQYERGPNHRNPLPSPDLSDDEAAGTHAANFAIIEPFSIRDATPSASVTPVLSLQSSRKRDATPPRRKQRQSHRQNKNKAENALNTRDFLRSMRSSRRNPGCSLWYLADDGKACPVL